MTENKSALGITSFTYDDDRKDRTLKEMIQDSLEAAVERKQLPEKGLYVLISIDEGFMEAETQEVTHKGEKALRVRMDKLLGTDLPFSVASGHTMANDINGVMLNSQGGTELLQGLLRAYIMEMFKMLGELNAAKHPMTEAGVGAGGTVH